MHRNPSRPLSPHLSVWRWGPHMLVSILHRITGAGLATVGAGTLVWWLAAAADGPEAYQAFVDCVTSPLGIAIGVGLSWAFFQHLFSGLRHFVMDVGAGYEIERNKFWATATIAAAIVATALLWAWLVVPT